MEPRYLELKGMKVINKRVRVGAPAVLLFGATLAAQQTTKYIPEDHRPPLFLRESWKDPGVQEVPVRQEHITNPDLELKLYGPGSADVRIVHHQSPKDDPTYIWSGSAPGNWALTLRDRNNYVDLRSPVSKIRWRTKEAGFHLLRPVLKLADGTFLVGSHVESYTADWLETEFALVDVRWRSLDSQNVVESRAEAGWKENPDLSRVDEVGFTDLSRGSGGGPGGGSRVDWIEVYGLQVPRDTGKTAVK
jgi:hypothetical protein